MTDYSSKNSSWKRSEDRRKWHSIVGVFVTIVLLLAVFNGVYKSFSLSKHVGESSWDSNSSFVAVLNTKPISLMIFDPTPKSLTFIKLSDDLYVSNSEVDNPVVKFEEVIGDRDAFLKKASEIFRIPVTNYIVFESTKEAGPDVFEEDFKQFASLVFPIKLLASQDFGVMDTNIAQIDIFRLWWQAKSLGLNDLNFIDGGDNLQEIVLADGSKVLGADDVSLHQLVLDYVENEKLSAENLEVEIINGSGDLSTGRMAADFISGLGGKVVSVEEADDSSRTIVAVSEDNSYGPNYLAKIFDCDIVVVPNLAPGKVRLMLGADFASKY